MPYNENTGPKLWAVYRPKTGEFHSGTWEYGNKPRIYTKQGASAACNRLNINLNYDKATLPFDVTGALHKKIGTEMRSTYWPYDTKVYTNSDYERAKKEHEDKKSKLTKAGKWEVVEVNVILKEDELKTSIRDYLSSNSGIEDAIALETVTQDLLNIIKQAQ